MKCSNVLKPKNIHIFSHMISASGKPFQEVNSEKSGRLNPGFIFVVKHTKDVVGMKKNLEEGLLV